MQNSKETQRLPRVTSSIPVWSVDRIGRLIVGIGNVLLLLATYFLSPYFLIGLLLINVNLVFTSVTDNCPFRNLLKRLGAKEREEFFYANGELIQDKKVKRFSTKLPQSENI